MFILDLNYHDGVLDQLDTLIPEHYAYLDRHLADGTFLLAGRKNPRTGGFILAQGDDRAAIDAIITEDPFHREGLAVYTVTKFQPTRSVISEVTV
ncbi:YciI family protein [Nocardia sp. NPDC059240]|uniref:YciI family protein n=1 Tax=Nocardia sp. NPDC059240 TaxID=3346786 RepID=UPI00367A1A93